MNLLRDKATGRPVMWWDDEDDTEKDPFVPEGQELVHVPGLTRDEVAERARASVGAGEKPGAILIADDGTVSAEPAPENPAPGSPGEPGVAERLVEGLSGRAPGEGVTVGDLLAALTAGEPRA